ncbi:MAG TPA: hypothetical protein VGJ78_09860 [Vicinamibacterales bacterium]
MTHLEHLINTRVEAATVTTITTATEKIAEEMAREILKDPVFREEMQTMIRRHFRTTIEALGTANNGRRAPGRAPRRRAR